MKMDILDNMKKRAETRAASRTMMVVREERLVEVASDGTTKDVPNITPFFKTEIKLREKTNGSK